MTDVQAQVRRLQASSLKTAELAKSRKRLTEYAREAKDLRDRKATVLKATDNLRQQAGELHIERFRLETEVAVFNARVTELSSEVAVTVAERDRVRHQLAARISRESKIRQLLTDWASYGTNVSSGDAATS